MSQLELKSILEAVPKLGLRDLLSLKSHVDMAVVIRSESEVSTDLEDRVVVKEESGLAENARSLLSEGVEDQRWTLADQAMLAAVILADAYHQETFSSRDINDVIEECGRPRVVHITSALSKLLERGYLEGSTKSLTLPAEGRSKARGLVSMLSREREAA